MVSVQEEYGKSTSQGNTQKEIYIFLFKEIKKKYIEK
jgi:hypothetical protein